MNDSKTNSMCHQAEIHKNRQCMQEATRGSERVQPENLNGERETRRKSLKARVTQQQRVHARAHTHAHTQKKLCWKAGELPLFLSQMFHCTQCTLKSSCFISHGMTTVLPRVSVHPSWGDSAEKDSDSDSPSHSHRPQLLKTVANTEVADGQGVFMVHMDSGPKIKKKNS